jgi:hypothetical protein
MKAKNRQGLKDGQDSITLAALAKRIKGINGDVKRGIGDP